MEKVVELSPSPKANGFSFNNGNVLHPVCVMPLFIFHVFFHGWLCMATYKSNHGKSHTYKSNHGKSQAPVYNEISKTNKVYYYTLNSLTLFRLAKSVQ